MKFFEKYLWLLLVLPVILLGCDGQPENETETQAMHPDDHREVIYFTEQQFNALGMKVDTLPTRVLHHYVETNGQLTLPPQSEATVTAIIGANIYSIKVIEGQRIRKGQVLAYLSHPELIQLQTDYMVDLSQIDYLKEEYERQKRLYEEEVGSGRDYQKARADYLAMQGRIKGQEAQIDLLGLNLERIKQGEIYERVPLFSPINGYIRSVNVRTGQFVDVKQELFEIVSNDHIHVHFQVFEKDINKVKEGQKVRFVVESQPDEEREAVIFSVGKVFESGPKAVHIHAEIENEDGALISGMYARGRIITEELRSPALPVDAVVREGVRHYLFTVEKKEDNGELIWELSPHEIRIGEEDHGWYELKLIEPLPENALVAWNNAYYLLSEWKKSDADHSH